MSDETQRAWIVNANARLALSEKFFWLSLTLMTMGSGVAQVLQHAGRDAETSQVALRTPNDATKRAARIDYTPTASIRRAR